MKISIAVKVTKNCNNTSSVLQLDSKLKREWFVKAAQSDYHALVALLKKEPKLAAIKITTSTPLGGPEHLEKIRSSPYRGKFCLPLVYRDCYMLNLRRFSSKDRLPVNEVMASQRSCSFALESTQDRAIPMLKFEGKSTFDLPLVKLTEK
ncbi:hypothetical protein TNCV_1409171 [Trichonephila clavipes]|uniref:Uncharacterized protein n=1 Tax=Trichonephila clavipes TaxID=2585209 RepID=A0A8X6R241_TRICX|nr:hypothetical protein TNCV_1409171 [Trichonephila clavipes]